MALPNHLFKPEAWSLVAEGYNQYTHPFLAKFAREATKFHQFSKNDVVLDLACGTGSFTLMVAHLVAKVVAVDFSEGMLREFNQRLELAENSDDLSSKNQFSNIDIKQMNGQALDFADGTFHSIWSMFGFMFFPDKQSSLRKIYQTVDGGCRV